MGYPTEPHLERHHHYRDHFTLDQWTQLAGYLAPKAAPPRPASPVLAQAEQAQQDELPVDFVPPTLAAPSMPQATFTDPPATPHIPPTAPPTSEDFITVSGTEFRAMVLLFQTLTTMHNALFLQMADIHAQQDQHTAIIHQIHQHLGLSPPQTDIPRPSEPIALAEETIPTEETITADVPPQATHETAPQPSCPPENPVP